MNGIWSLVVGGVQKSEIKGIERIPGGIWGCGSGKGRVSKEDMASAARSGGSGRQRRE